MKRTDLERHLRAHDCQVLREGARHTIWAGPDDGRTPVPCRRQIPRGTARAICRQLGVPPP